jgi:FkbH-like protein
VILRRSRFLHQIPVGDARILVVHAVSQNRRVVDANLIAVINFFATPRALPEEFEALATLTPASREGLVNLLAAMTDEGILTQKSADEELAEASAEFAPTHGRDPAALLDGFRRARKIGGEAYWAAGSALAAEDYAPARHKLRALVLGDCDLQMETDFLRQEARARGIDLEIAATFPDDVRLAGERAHDIILVGALRSRHAIAETIAPGAPTSPFGPYIAEAQRVIEGLRRHSTAPILIDNLPEPTVQPLGMAERGLDGHRNRFRLANAALADLVDRFADVHVVDVAAALAAEGAARLLDDGQVGFTHFGSPGWMLQRPASEKAAVHDLFPDLAPLADLVGGDAYLRERAMAKTHVDALVTVLGVDAKKCVIVDLDGVLWPGVLAETGAPFAFDPAISSPFSYVGLYFGLHEALLSLKRRGVVLACVSKNDEATVRELWTYDDHYPRDRLLTPDDFVTWRVNWDDKTQNIASIAEELGFALESFLFIDDHPVERERVRQRLPQVEVWGENPFELRARLLNDPRLQTPRLSQTAASRTDLVKAQIGRQHFRRDAASEADYIASLNIQCRIEPLTPDSDLGRIEELFQRTTQFNATGRHFPISELAALLAAGRAQAFALHVTDRFGDHGLVGAAVIEAGEIAGFALSCRVLGMGIEHLFLKAILEAAAGQPLVGRIIETPRNNPVRNLYRDNGFTQRADRAWTSEAKQSLAG